MKKIKFKGSKPAGHPLPVVSYGIRIIEWSNISHTFIEFPEEDLVFHARFNSMLFEKASEYNKTIHIEYEFTIDVEDEVYAEIKSLCEALAGKKSGYFTQLLGIFLSAPPRWLGFKIRNPLTKFYNSMVCSEVCRLVAVDFLKFKELEDAPDPDNYYTKDLIKLMKNNLDKSGQEFKFML